MEGGTWNERMRDGLWDIEGEKIKGSAAVTDANFLNFFFIRSFFGSDAHPGSHIT